MTIETELPAVKVNISDLIDRYWQLAYAEGAAGATTDTEAGDAQECRSAIDAVVAAFLAAESRCEALVEALQNVMGVYDTPLSRRRFPPDDFMNEALASARAALKELGKGDGR